MTFKPIVLLAVLSTTAILACKDDPSGLGGTGSLVLIVVPYEEAQPTAEADAKGETAATDAGEPNPSVTPAAPAAAEGRSRGEEVTEAPNAGSAAEATQQQQRDIVRVTLIGPTSFSEDFFPNADGSVDVTITDLLVGSYEIQLFGIDQAVGGDVVSEFGSLTGVLVQEDQTTQRTIPFGSFVPVIDPTLPPQTSEFAFAVDYTAIPAATGYFFELDTDPSFPAPTTLSTTGTSVIISVDAPGPNWMRVRAVNNNVSAAQAKPSDPVLVDVVVDVNPTGDDNTTAPSLGSGSGANGQYSGYNIYPADDEDWFSVDLVNGTKLTVDVLTSSLAAPSSLTQTLALEAEAGMAPSVLDPVVYIYDPLLTLLDSNDDRDPGIIIEARVTDVPINADGTYFIRVTSYSQMSVGHYELLINVNAPADPTQSTVSGSPTSIPADGVSTSAVTVQLADALGNPLSIGGDAVTLATDLGTIGLVTDNGDGTYTAILTSGFTPGFATISGTVNAVAIPTGIVTFRGTSPPDLIGSTSGGGGPGSGGTNPSALYSIDRTTGGATPIGMIGFNRVGAMDVHPTTGVLYAAAQRASDGVAVLITIDQTTGVGTEIGVTGIQGAISDLSFHSNGTLYGHFAIGGSHALHTFNTGTGLATLIGLTGIAGQGSGMTFNGTNSLFLASSSNLYALSTATGSGPNLGFLTYSNPSCDRVKAIDRDPATSVLYAALECGATDALGTLEITAGTATFIGSSVADLDGFVVPGTSTAPTTGPASALTSTITAPAGPIDADGVATAAVTVQLFDATSTALTVGGDHVTLSTTLGTLSAVTDNGNGTYSATLTSSTTAGTATVSGTINGVAISSTLNIVFISLSPQWIQLAPTGTPPAARQTHTAVIDVATNQMIVFGGAFGSTRLNDLWSLTDANGVGTPTWNSVVPVGGPPTARWLHEAVYDAANNRMILFGGAFGSTSPCTNDVWVLSNANGVGGTPTWTQLFPTGGPAPRANPSIVYDAATNRLTVFGGNDCFATYFSDVWVLSNANGLGGTPTWTQLTPGTPINSPRQGHEAAYDPVSNRMIVFGGGPVPTPMLNEVWVLTNANGLGGTPNWIQLTPAAPPPGRNAFDAVYDVSTNRMTIFGGSTSTVLLNDVWVLSDANGLGSPLWTQLTPTGTPPLPMHSFNATYDTGTNRMIIFGGNDGVTALNDVWVLTRANGQ